MQDQLCMHATEIAGVFRTTYIWYVQVSVWERNIVLSTFRHCNSSCWSKLEPETPAVFLPGQLPSVMHNKVYQLSLYIR